MTLPPRLEMRRTALPCGGGRPAGGARRARARNSALGSLSRAGCVPGSSASPKARDRGRQFYGPTPSRPSLTVTDVF